VEVEVKDREPELVTGVDGRRTGDMKRSEGSNDPQRGEKHILTLLRMYMFITPYTPIRIAVEYEKEKKEIRLSSSTKYGVKCFLISSHFL
jgi:hypothetical protein